LDRLSSRAEHQQTLHRPSTSIEMPATTLTDLPPEVLENIFQYILVLEPGAFIRNPIDGSRLSSSKVFTSQLEASRGVRGTLVPYGSLWYRFRRRPAQDIHVNILFVSKQLCSIAERILYSRNRFLFSSARDLQQFVKHVNKPTSLGLHRRTHHISRLCLWDNGDIHGSYKWIPYLQTRNLVRDFPRLKGLEVGFLSMLPNVWGFDPCTIHPALVDQWKVLPESSGIPTSMEELLQTRRQRAVKLLALWNRAAKELKRAEAISSSLVCG